MSAAAWTRRRRNKHWRLFMRQAARERGLPTRLPATHRTLLGSLAWLLRETADEGEPLPRDLLDRDVMWGTRERTP